MIAERVIEICRYDPDKDVLPYMQRFEVDIDQKDRMVPDVPVRLKSVDESISLRRSCREAPEDPEPSTSMAPSGPRARPA